MSNTPKPQANTLDETFEWLDKLSKLNKLGGRGHGDLKDVCYICGISPNALKVQIQALITEARIEARIELIEEILELPDTNGGCEDSHVKAKFTSWFDRRLAQLKENK